MIGRLLTWLRPRRDDDGLTWRPLPVKHDIVLHLTDTRYRTGHGHWYSLNGAHGEFSTYLPDALTCYLGSPVSRIRLTVEYLPDENDPTCTCAASPVDRMPLVATDCPTHGVRRIYRDTRVTRDDLGLPEHP